MHYACSRPPGPAADTSSHLVSLLWLFLQMTFLPYSLPGSLDQVFFPWKPGHMGEISCLTKAALTLAGT